MEMTGDEDLAYELLQMIEGRLNFMHPYLPMTPTKRLTLLDFLEKEWDKSTKISRESGSNATIKTKFQAQFFSCEVNNDRSQVFNDACQSTHRFSKDV
jgi:hypothetical protein